MVSRHLLVEVDKASAGLPYDQESFELYEVIHMCRNDGYSIAHIAHMLGEKKSQILMALAHSPVNPI